MRTRRVTRTNEKVSVSAAIASHSLHWHGACRVWATRPPERMPTTLLYEVRKVRIGSVFSGVEGLGLGFEWVFGFAAEVVFQVEKDPFCRSVLDHYWPTVPKFDDVCTVGAHNLPPCDLLIGGFPCQDVSSAGPRTGLSGARSGLWFEYARIVGELRPDWVVVENVASGAGNWVTEVRCSLERLGYESVPIPLSAADCGAPHRRARVFVVARSELANSRSVRREEQPEARVHAGGQLRDDAAGRRVDLRWHWPPGPVDQEGWTRWLADGGVGPSVQRPVDGLSSRLRRQALRAYGNAVTPHQAAVIACVVKMLVERLWDRYNGPDEVRRLGLLYGESGIQGDCE